MGDQGECDGDDRENAMPGETERTASKPENAGVGSITGSRKPARAATKYDPDMLFSSSSSPSPPPPRHSTRNSTMHSRVDVSPKRHGRREKSRLHGRSPNLHSGPTSSQDVYDGLQIDGASHSSAHSLASTRGQQSDLRRRIPSCTSDKYTDALCTASPLPPVTKASLEELDLMWIQANINLRVDINYDHDLHFMPVSGMKGQQKRQEARKYWLSLEAELRIMSEHDLLASCAECAEKCASHSAEPMTFIPRLPLMFHHLKELLAVLVPDRDQDQIAQNLDVSLLMQEANHGVLDVVRLASWLCELLTTHCAPMRDESAQEMVAQIKDGQENGDLKALVAGIEKLFAFLEAMKLDVANHQIRSFRYQLIDDTVPFQQDFFRARINNKTLDVTPSKNWYEAASLEHKNYCQIPSETQKTSPLGSLVHGLVTLCVSPNLDVPVTLTYDKARLKEMRDRIQDIIHLDICLSTFDQLIQQLVGPKCNPSAMHGALENRLLDLTDCTTSSTIPIPDIWLQNVNAIALELTRAAFHVCRHAGLPFPESVEAITFQLKTQFEHEKGYCRNARALGPVLEQATREHASVFQNMTTLAISENQKHWKTLQQQRQPWRNVPDLQDLARKLAHIAAIHWKVWAELVYLQGEEHEIGMDGSIDGVCGDQEMVGITHGSYT